MFDDTASSPNILGLFLEASFFLNHDITGESQAYFKKKHICHLSAQSKTLEKLNSKCFKKYKKAAKKAHRCHEKKPLSIKIFKLIM